MKVLRTLVWLSVLLCISGSLRAEECSKCRGLGRVPCKAHAVLNVGGIRVGDFTCADCLDLECCHGIGWNACPKCKNEKAQGEWKEAFEERKGVCTQLAELFEKKWIDAEKCRFVKERDARKRPAAQVEQEVPRRFLNILRAPHVIMATDIAGRRVKLTPQSGLAPIDAHQTHHLYLARCLEVFHDVEDLHRPGAFDRRGLTAKERAEPIKVPALAGIDYVLFMFANEEAQRRMTAHVFNQETGGSISGPGLTSVFEDSVTYPSDPDLHRYVYGAFAGSLIHQYNDDPERSKEEREKDESLPAWLTQGFEHVLAMRRWGLCEEAGVQETRKVDNRKGVEGWNPSNWPAAVSKLIGTGRARPFPELSKLVLDDMQCSDHQVAWSYVDFLLHQGMDKLAKLTPLLRKPGSDQAQALREAYGMTQAELEDAWKAFVLKP